MRNITELFRVQAAIDTTSGVVIAVTITIVVNADGIHWELSLCDMLGERLMWKDEIDVRISIQGHVDNKERQACISILSAKAML